MKLWHKKYPARRPLLRTWVIILLFVAALGIFYKTFIGPGSKLIHDGTVRLYVKDAVSARDSIDSYLDCEVEEIEAIGEVLSAMPGEEHAKRVLDRFIDGEEWMRSITYFDEGQKAIYRASQFSASDDPNEGADHALPIQAISFPMNGSPYISKISNGDQAFPSLVIGVPVIGESGKIVGTLVAELSMQEMRNIIKDVEHDSPGSAYLVDEEGYLIAHPDDALVLARTSVLSRSAVTDVIKNRSSVQRFSAGNEYVNEKGEKVYVVGIPLAMAGWGIFVEQPVKYVEESYEEVKVAGLIMGPTLALLLLSLIFNEGVLVGAFSDLEKGRESLSAKVEKENKELRELDKATKLLVARDRELSETNQKLDEKIKELEESKNKTLAIISNFIDPIVVLDREGKINFFNPAATRILGLDIADIGRQVPDKHNYSLKNFNEVFKVEFDSKKLKGSPSNELGNELSVEEITLKPKEEELTYKVITAKIIEEKRGELGVMKIFYDLTREKAIDNMKSEFISVVAHQLRTPLSAIKWSLKMILDGDAGDVNDEQKEFLLKGYESNQRMIELVNDLLNVSRIEEGRFGYNFEIANFEEVLTHVVTELQELFDAKHIGLIIKKPKSLPQLFIDKAKMALVLQNLINNSLKYTPEYGKIEIQIAKKDNEILIKVKDNGVGIPERDKPKIFKKFFRATNVIRMETEGSGLGLFMVKNIVEKHKGTIQLTSEEGKGTEVLVALPVIRVEA